MKIVADSSANVMQLQKVAFAVAPLKIITAQREFVDDPSLDLEDMIRYFESYKGRSQTSCPNPEDWRKAILEGIPELLTGFDGSAVAGIGCGGQMHGLVILDENDNVIRPAILWNDGRTAAQVDYLNYGVGREKLSAMTANIAFAGFTAPKILWIRENEPENFAKITKIIFKKII